MEIDVWVFALNAFSNWNFQLSLDFNLAKNHVQKQIDSYMNKSG